MTIILGLNTTLYSSSNDFGYTDALLLQYQLSYKTLTIGKTSFLVGPLKNITIISG